MAAIYLPSPGETYGPCIGQCEHRDCAQTRLDAYSRCRWCNNMLGYARAVYLGPPAEHEVCLAEAIARGDA